jgi:NAD(P)-dependent dehydrogenase (short-subunit alcohol dehydrogenase family)
LRVVNKTILITGGSSGIGLTAARRLAAAGHQVFSASRNPSRNPLPEGVTPIVCDVADPECGAVVREILAATGRLDALVNNAGFGELVAVEEGTDDNARQIVEVNLLGPMRLARAVIPIMRDQGAGHIVNVTSLNDLLAVPFLAWYSATKAALAATSYSLAAEVAQFGIRVTVVAPGLFRTDMAEALPSFQPTPDSKYFDALAGLTEMNKQRILAAGDPDEVGAVIEECINDADPPIRIVVGDTEGLQAMAADPNLYVAMFARAVAGAGRST